MLENQLEKQPQKNNDGKRLLFTILIALAWLMFIGLLLFTSSKCAKATDYYSVHNAGASGASYQRIHYVWYDGTNYHYDYSTNHYIITYDTSTEKFSKSTVTWNNVNNFDGMYVWNIGSTYYLSNGGYQYELDPVNLTVTAKTWNYVNNFDGRDVFNIGNDYYLGRGSSQYKLDLSTSTWSTYTWNGNFNTINGSYVWYDGTYYHHDVGSEHWYLDTSTNTWSTYTFNGIGNFNGNSVLDTPFGIICLDTANHVYLYDNGDFVLWNDIDDFWGCAYMINYVGIVAGYLTFGASNSVNFIVKSNTVSGGGYTQQDLDNAYASGQLNALNDAASATHGSGTTYSAYSSSAITSEVNNAYNSGFLHGQVDGYTAGVTQGHSDVTSNPNDYNLYTSTQYNDYGTQQYNAGVTYADGIVNTSSASYTAGYTAGQLDSSNYQDGYDAGRVYVLTYVSVHGGNGVHYSTYTDEHLQYQIDYIYKDGQVSIANAASSYQYGSGEIYTRFQNMLGAVHEEMDYAHQSGYDAGYTYAQDYWTKLLLNIASGQNGSGTVYNSFDMTDYTNELSAIYSTGITNGAAESYNSTYNAGYSAGQSVVLDNPNEYDLYTSTQYNDYGSTRFNSGYVAGKADYQDVECISLSDAAVGVASVPYVIVSSLFNFDILGVNVFIFVTSIFSLMLCIWVVKKLWK